MTGPKTIEGRQAPTLPSSPLPKKPNAVARPVHGPSTPMQDDGADVAAKSTSPDARGAAVLLAAVAVAWGLNWPVGKAMLAYVSPIWATTMRSAIASLTLAMIALARGQLAWPRRDDLPVILSVGVLHMTMFAALMGVGLKYLPASRAVVLAYTTPLWVVPGAWLLLGERTTRRRLAGVALGLMGLMWILGPTSFDGHGRGAVLGNVLILLAALSWSISILVVRRHRWTTPTSELTLWQALLATGLLAALARLLEGPPHIAWQPRLAGLLLYGGVVGSGLAYSAATSVNRRLPASLTALGFLGVPLVGVASSALLLGEKIGGPLLGALLLITGGIALGAIEPGTIVGWLRVRARRRDDEADLLGMDGRDLNDLAIGRGEVTHWARAAPQPPRGRE